MRQHERVNWWAAVRLPSLAAASGAIVLLLALAGSASSFAPAASSTWVVSGGQNGGGVVASTAVSGSAAYLGGNFTYVGPPTGSFVGADSAGALASTWPAVGGNVYAVAPDGSNGFFIGGQFSSVGTRHANNVAHIKSDGTLDTAWTGSTDGTVFALAVSGGSVYAGGDFDHAGGAARTNLAAFSASNGALVTAFTANATGTADAAVLALEASGSVLYVGGDFSSLGGSSHANLGAVDAGTGTATGWGPSTDGVVFALAVGGGVVYVGGSFLHVNVSTERNNVAAFSATTGAPTSWDPIADADVYALEYTGTAVYAGGAFTQIGDQPRNGIGALDLQGFGLATSWNPNVGVDGQVYSLAVSGTTVYAGGLFRNVNGTAARDNAVGFDATTGTATGFATVIGGAVDALAVSGATVGIGGEFRSAGAGGPTSGPVPRSNLAAIDLTTGKATDWNPGANDTVEVLAVSGSTIYAGGAFTAANGLTRHRLAAFTTAGAATPWNPGVHNGRVLALTVGASTVYVGGTFSGTTSVSNPPVERNFAAAFQASGQGNGFGDLTSWNPNPNNSVIALDAIGSTVFLGGSFTNLIPKPAAPQVQYDRSRLAGVSASGIGIPTNWNPNLNGSVLALTHVGTTVYAGGAFTTVNGNKPRGGGAAFSASGTGTATDWNPEALLSPGQPGTVYSLVASGSSMYVGGIFDSVGGPWTGSPAACTLPCFLSPSVGAVSLTLGVPNITWAPAADDNVLWLALAPQGLVMGGAFTATGFPPLGSPVNADEPAAAYRGGFALVRALPDAPTNVTATPGNTTTTVAWQAPAYTGGGPVTSYAIVVDPDGTVLTDVTSPTTVTGLTNGAAYTFSVLALTSAGIGEAGVSSTVTPRTVPGAPTNVSAMPGNGQATVHFTAPVSNGGSPITLYTATSSPDNLTGTSTDGSDIVVNGLRNGSSYVFTVTATNAAGTGPASATSSPVTPRTVPGAPTDVVATAGNTQASVSFAAPISDGGAPITDYVVTSSPPAGVPVHGTTSPLTVPGLTNGQAYTFTVTASNIAGSSLPSPASNAITPGSPPTAPGAPTGASAAAGNGQATVHFTAPASNGGDPITKYTVTSSPESISVDGTASPIIVPGLTNGQSYTFTVTATNTVGTSAPSGPTNGVTPTTGATAPDPPTGVTATPANGQAKVAFTPASDGGSAITDYTVTSSPGNKTAHGSGSPITVDGLTNGASYTFRVTATNAIGTSQPSSPSNAVTPTFVAIAPGTPTGVTATAGNGFAVVTFTPPVSDGGATITSYTVSSSPGNRTAGSSGSPIIVTGLTNGQAYTFTVTATNSAGTGTASPASAPIVPIQSPRQAAPAPPAVAPRPEVPVFVPPAGSRPQVPAH